MVNEATLIEAVFWQPLSVDSGKFKIVLFEVVFPHLLTEDIQLEQSKWGVFDGLQTI
jgi:hypothetical protein